MRSLIQFSLSNKYMMIGIGIIIMIFGFVQMRNMPVDVLPEFSPPFVEIQTEALGLSAEEVESLITVPLEADLLNGVAWLDAIHSESITGLSSITLIFEPGTNPIRARQMVQERLTQAHALPNVSKPPVMLQPLSSTSRVMVVGLSSETLSLIDMSVLARWNIVPRLTGVPGVANVSIWGQRKRQLQVQVDPQRLHDEGVSLQQVIKTTGEALWVSPLSYLEASTPGTGGFIDTPNQRLPVRHILPIISPEDLGKVALVDSEENVMLGEVTNVVEDHQPLIGDTLLGNKTGLLLVIEKFPGENTVAVTRDVETALVALQQGLTGIEVDTTIYRPANYVETAIGNNITAVVIAAIIGILVLTAFYWNWRAVLVIVLTVPISVGVAGFVLSLLGTTFNGMILAGLVVALAVIVDDVVVDIGNVMRRLREREVGSEGAQMAMVTTALTETRYPMIYTILALIAAVLPIFFMMGLAGTFLQSAMMAYVLAIAASLLVSLFVTPALTLLLFANAPAPGVSPVVRALSGAYQGVLTMAKKPTVAYIVGVVLVIAGLAIVPLLQQSFFPVMKERDLLIQWQAAAGTSRLAMNRITAQATQELEAIPGVNSVSAHMGRAILSDENVSINSSEIWVNIDPTANYERSIADVQDVVNGYPGFSRNVLTYLEERVRREIIGGNDNVIVRIFGSELDLLQEKAVEMQQAVFTVQGVSDVQIDFPPPEPVVEIEVDLVAAEQHRIKPGDVRRVATTLLSGIEVGNLFEEQKVFDVVVWGIPEIRHSLTDIRNMPIEVPSGELVPLADLATVEIVPVPNVIQRDAVSRIIDLNVTIDGRNPNAVIADIQSALTQVSFPIEYHAEVLGDFAQRQAIQRRVWSLILTVAIAIFLLLQACFDSWRLAFLAFFPLPVALAGGTLILFVTGTPFSMGALLGFLLILSIAIRNSTMLLRHYQNLQQVEGVVFNAELMIRGATERLAPTLVTTMGIGLALLPIIFFGDMIGFEITQPLVVVMLGGGITTLFMSLFVVPSLYLAHGFIPIAERAQTHSQEGALVS